ncbi:GNAT family N-acetyltransferase [Nonomuraea sp. NPDC003707]
MRGNLVSLEPVSEEDYELIARWSGESAGVLGQGTPVFVSPDSIREGVESPMTAGSRSGYFMVASLAGRKIGVVSWTTMAYPDSYTGASRIGDPRLWAHGYGMEANILLLGYLFQQRNAHRVHMPVGLYNRQMIQMATRGYFVLEGILRDYFYLDGAYCDAAVYSVLRHEYYALAAAAPEAGLAVDLIPEEHKREARRMLVGSTGKTAVMDR